MLSLKPGKYSIQLPLHHNIKVGVDANGANVRPVVPHGNLELFFIKGAGQNTYTFTIKDVSGKTLYVQSTADERVVASVNPPPTGWVLTPQPGGHYTITLPNPNPSFPPLGWTATGFQNFNPVVLEPVPVANPVDVQLWDLVFQRSD